MSKYENAVLYLSRNGMGKTLILGMIYGLYQDYQIDEDEESYLYHIVDPEDKYNDVSDYWRTLEDNTKSLLEALNKFPDYDGEWFFDGEYLMNYSETDIDALADLLKDYNFPTGTFEEGDGTGYTGKTYIHLI